MWVFPWLRDFNDSIVARSNFEADADTPLSSVKNRGTWVGRKLMTLTYGRDQVMEHCCQYLINNICRDSVKPRILVIGGGTIGSGAEALYQQRDLELVGTDIYPSEWTSLVCDGHKLPFADEAFDGVIIQAVLEHVLVPETVVSEIYRVLKYSGMVCAGTPFMQQVHEGAYDFTRYTASGHRWLFRRFDEMESGIVGGPGIALLWSIAYFARSLGASRAVSSVLTAPFFWVRLLDRFTNRRPALDAASGVYFLGRKSQYELRPSDMPAYYEAQTRTC
jgi:SAM-dependent methyltransferase